MCAFITKWSANSRHCWHSWVCLESMFALCSKTLPLRKAKFLISSFGFFQWENRKKTTSKQSSRCFCSFFLFGVNKNHECEVNVSIAWSLSIWYQFDARVFSYGQPAPKKLREKIWSYEGDWQRDICGCCDDVGSCRLLRLFLDLWQWERLFLLVQVAVPISAVRVFAVKSSIEPVNVSVHHSAVVGPTL